MDKPYRRYEVLLPLRFNDGNSVPDELLAETILKLERSWALFRVSRRTSAASGATKDSLTGTTSSASSSTSPTCRKAGNFSSPSRSD